MEHIGAIAERWLEKMLDEKLQAMRDLYLQEQANKSAMPQSNNDPLRSKEAA